MRETVFGGQGRYHGTIVLSDKEIEHLFPSLSPDFVRMFDVVMSIDISITVPLGSPLDREIFGSLPFRSAEPQTANRQVANWFTRRKQY